MKHIKKFSKLYDLLTIEEWFEVANDTDFLPINKRYIVEFNRFLKKYNIDFNINVIEYDFNQKKNSAIKLTFNGSEIKYSVDHKVTNEEVMFPISEIVINLGMDDWFYVAVRYANKGRLSEQEQTVNFMSTDFYKCDSIDGVEEFFEDKIK